MTLPDLTPATNQNKINTIMGAGIACKKVDKMHFAVGPFLFWPATDTWRTPDGSVRGYGVQNLILAARAATCAA